MEVSVTKEKSSIFKWVRESPHIDKHGAETCGSMHRKMSIQLSALLKLNLCGLEFCFHVLFLTFIRDMTHCLLISSLQPC